MKFSYTSLALAALITSVAAIPTSHASLHEKKAVSLVATDASRLTSMGFKSAGINAQSSKGGNVWIGGGGQFTNTFTNDSGESLILVIWGPNGSWVNANQPLITVSLAKGASTTISFANGQSGAWSTVKSHTKLVNGQVSNTWGEYTFTPTYGTYDVSREPNMSGDKMSIVGPKCTSDFDRCVFVCNAGNVCMTGYTLKNCAAGSQPGATYGTYGGADSGGCQGLGNGAALKTSLK